MKNKIFTRFVCVFFMVLLSAHSSVYAQQMIPKTPLNTTPLLSFKIPTPDVSSETLVRGLRFDAVIPVEIPNAYRGDNCVDIPNAYTGDIGIPIPNLFKVNPGRPAQVLPESKIKIRPQHP